MTSGMASVTKKLLLYTSNFRNKELLVFLHDAKCLNRSTNQLTSPLRGADCRWLARWPNDLKSSSVLRWLLKECTVLVESIPSLCFIGHCMNICIRRYRLRNCWKITAFSKYIRVCAYSVLLVDDFFLIFLSFKVLFVDRIVLIPRYSVFRLTHWWVVLVTQLWTAPVVRSLVLYFAVTEKNERLCSR